MGILKDVFDGGASEAKKMQEKSAASLAATLGEQYGLGYDKLLEGLSAIDTSYLNTKGALSTAGDNATLAILENQTGQMAELDQDLIGSGMSGTTVKSNAKAQIAKGTNVALSGLAEKLGLLQAGVETNYGAAKNNALQGIAKFAMDKVGQENAITPHYEAAGGGILGDLGGIIGSTLGSGGLSSLLKNDKKED